MFKRVGMVILMVMLLPWLAPEARAAQTGSIRVTVEEEGRAGDGTVILFRVGDQVEDGYRILDAFGGGLVKMEDALSSHLARWLAELEGGEGTAKLLDEEGSALFSGLEEGLYLLVQAEEGEQPIQPFLVTIPYAGQWNVYAYPNTWKIDTESPATGQHPAPLLGALGMVLTSVGLVLCVKGKQRKK